MTIALERLLIDEALARGVSVLALAQERRRLSDGPIRCGQLNAIITVRRSEGES